VTVAEDQRLVHIRVIDSGCGVPASIRQTLFQPFVSTEKINGIGLGLAIVNCIVKEHGGYVDLEESRPGRTVFGLHLSKYALENFASR
jgi:nitrogen-specific signal transduction histidine kinase